MRCAFDWVKDPRGENFFDEKRSHRLATIEFDCFVSGTEIDAID
jgi:hypothetical protein